MKNRVTIILIQLATVLLLSMAMFGQGAQPSPQSSPAATQPNATGNRDLDDKDIEELRTNLRAMRKELMAQNPDEWAAFRPEILGTLAIGHEDGAYTMAVYCTSESAAREGERKEPPPRIKAQMDEMNQMNIGMPTFYDLRQPWLYSP